VNCDTTIDIYRNNEVSTLEYYEKRAAEDRIDFAERISWISASFSPGRILDVGANIGTFCQIAREQGWTPTAIELNGNAANRCRAQGFDVWEQTLEQMPDKKYDFIHLSDVIEHVEDPLELLHNANRLTAPGSGIFVSTPDFGNPLVWPIQFTPPEHISLFNHRSLLAALENASFRVLNVRRRSRTRAFHANGRVTQR
jgi:2-polyprenyl-3-methyl-5-hydroxy-6-metoxy-1,4-benzoquinol methylase